ncbi:MAG: sodium:proton antiporter [Elusimicrobia bacterium CG11_big_fil_rev_8_21_14_0_20_64_6]|nr:MAG: sodium:proton antiporter [Elusimicrobia bacterium CG11_big_fil_rev_8_21_14_0_20_64_6]
MHELEIVRFLAELLVILLSAKLFGELAERMGQPAVLGELIGGVVLGTGVFTFFHLNDPALALMSEIGVILLLFETGIHSDLGQLLKAGPTASAVAGIGVVVPFILGWGIMTALGKPGMEAVFVGAALTATSVGITARVLSDMGKLSLPEAQIVLGAAVIDDVMGIIILSAVQGIAVSGSLQWFGVLKTILLSAGFLTAALWLGPYFSSALIKIVHRMRVRGVLVGTAVCFAFAMALTAHALGTAMIVGAFTAGILLARTDKKEDIDATVRPVVDIFAPVFFVMVGAKVDLSVFNPSTAENRAVLGLAALLILAAVAGKIVSAFAVRDRKLNRWAVGFGMIPRGEVGLIFAQIGLAAGIVEPGLYAAVVAMVIVTTFLAPPLLKNSLS